MQHLAIVTTVATIADARRIADALVERRLAACVQISQIESCYWWKDAVQREPEWRLLCKTTSERHQDVITAIKGLHPYELPAIHALALEHVDAAYGAWIEANSSGDAGGTR